MNRRALSAVAAAALAALGSPAIAAASCALPDHFAEADRAPRIAVVQAAAAPGPFRVQLHVQQVLKGAAKPTAVTVGFNPMSGTSMRPGERYVVFFEGSDTVAGGCATIALRDPALAAMEQAIASWVKATDPASRVDLLIRLGTSPAPEGRSRVASGALAHLGARPDLLAEVAPAGRARLVAAIPSAVDDRAYGLSWVLARLHAIESIPAWVRFLGTPHPSANHRPVQDALELMTNHHDPGYTPGRDFHGEQAERLRAAWAAWHTANGSKPLPEIVAAGSRERGARSPALGDRAALAITVRDEKDELARRVALNACEILLRTPTSSMPRSGESVDWSKATTVCSVPAPARPPPR